MSSLPTREASSFKIMMGLYDNKNYLKALKTAEQILKKCPNHGETNAMKALLIYYLDSKNKEEALVIAKQAIKMDLKSSLCWHILAIIYKGNSEFEEAVKCFAQASKIDPGNHRLLNESSIIYLQLGQIDNFFKTRASILNLRPGYVHDWITLAFACDLNSKTDMAVDALTKSCKQFNNFEGLTEYERSEVFLYQATCMESLGQYEEAFKLLESMQQYILDKTTYYTILGRLAIRINHEDNVHEIYKKLFELNCENLPCALILLSTYPDNALVNLFTNHNLNALESAIKDAEMTPSRKMGVYRENLSFFNAESPSNHPNVELDYPAYCVCNSTPIVLGDDVFDIYKTSPGWSIPQRQHMIFDRYSTYSAKVPFRDLFVSSYSNYSNSNNPFCYRTNSLKKWDGYPVFIQTRQLEPDEFVSLNNAIKHLQIEFPKSQVLEQLKIALMPIENYKNYCMEYLDKFFSRGVYNIFQYLDSILNLEKILATVEITKDLIKTNDELHYRLSAKMLLSSLYHLLGDSSKSLSLIDELIPQAPTCLDLLALKARILADLGNFTAAADNLITACKIDMSDRDTSAFCARMLARDGRNDMALNEWNNYLSHEINERKNPDLIKVLSMRFAKEQVRGYLKNKQFELAFNQCSMVIDQFFECKLEQADLYNYSISRLAFLPFKSYIYTIDDLFNSNYFQHFLKIYLNLGIKHSMLTPQDIKKILFSCHNCLDPGAILALYNASLSIAQDENDGHLFRLQCIYRVMQYGLFSRHSLILLHHFLTNVKLDGSILNKLELSLTRKIILLISSKLSSEEAINCDKIPKANGNTIITSPELLESSSVDSVPRDDVDISKLHKALMESAFRRIKETLNPRIAFSLALGMFECENVIDNYKSMLDDVLKYVETLFNFNNKLSLLKCLKFIDIAQNLGFDVKNIIDQARKLYPQADFSK